MALRKAISSRGLAAAALKQLVKPASSMRRAFTAVFSMCSSGGMKPSSTDWATSVNERWECASMRPGISVAPRPSITIASPAASVAPAGTTAAMRLPSTRTEPVKGCAPEQSRTLTFLNRVALMLRRQTRLQVFDIHPVPRRTDDQLVDAGMGRHLRDEADGVAKVFRLQHLCAIRPARRDGAPVHDRRGHFGRADRTGTNAVRALFHVDGFGHGCDGLLASGIVRARQLGVIDVGSP